MQQNQHTIKLISFLNLSLVSVKHYKLEYNNIYIATTKMPKIVS